MWRVFIAKRYARFVRTSFCFFFQVARGSRRQLVICVYSGFWSVGSMHTICSFCFTNGISERTHVSREMAIGIRARRVCAAIKIDLNKCVHGDYTIKPIAPVSVCMCVPDTKLYTNANRLVCVCRCTHIRFRRAFMNYAVSSLKLSATKMPDSHYWLDLRSTACTRADTTGCKNDANPIGRVYINCQRVRADSRKQCVACMHAHGDRESLARILCAERRATCDELKLIICRGHYYYCIVLRRRRQRAQFRSRTPHIYYEQINHLS